jgi:C1A family cysteine protease
MKNIRSLYKKILVDLVLLLTVFGVISFGMIRLVHAQTSGGDIPQAAPLPVVTDVGDGLLPPPVNPGYKVAAGFGMQAALPANFDWRDNGLVSPVKNQGSCGACYSFASLGNFESRLLIDSAGDFDLSENNVQNCSWKAQNTDTSGGCQGGNYVMVADVLSQFGSVLESCDPYTGKDDACNSSCPYQQTLLDMRILSGDTVPSTELLKTYLQTVGPIYTSMYTGFPEFQTYDGSYTLYYQGSENTAHAVLIVGWDDQLGYTRPDGTLGSGAWIVKNSWGPAWGDGGYFTIAYGSAGIGKYATYGSEWQAYDPNGKLYFKDEAGWTISYGYTGATTAWGMVRLTPDASTYATRVEFWMGDSGTADIYIYDTFENGTLSNLLTSIRGVSYAEAGYHSVELPDPLALTTGDEVAVVVKFSDQSYVYPVATDNLGQHSAGVSYISNTGTTWYDLGAETGDVSIRLRTTHASQTISLITPPPSSAAYQSTFTLAAEATSGLAVVYSSGSPEVCTVSGANYTMTRGSGTCIVQIDQAGGEGTTYGSAPRVTRQVTAKKISQNLQVTIPPPEHAAYKSSFTVAALSSSGLAVSYSSGSPSICSNTGPTFSMLSGTGTCQVNYTQAGNEDYDPASPETAGTTAQKISQTISFITPPPENAGFTSSFTVMAVSTSGLPVGYSSGSSKVCTATGPVFQMTNSSGTCVIFYNQPGDLNYNPASQETSLVYAQKGTQTIFLTGSVRTSAAFQSTFTVSAEATSGLEVLYNSGSPAVCTNTGAAFTMLSSSGICIVEFSQAGNGSYNAALPVQATVTAVKAAQIIEVTLPPPAAAAFGTRFSVAAVADSGLEVGYNSSSLDTCTNDGREFTVISQNGTCLVQFSQAGDTNFEAASRVVGRVEISTTSQKFTLQNGITYLTLPGSSFSLAGRASLGPALVFGSHNPAICRVSGGLFTLIRDGDGCALQLDLRENTNFGLVARILLYFTIFVVILRMPGRND